MKKYLLYAVVITIILIIFFRPAGFVNTKGDGKIDIDFENAEISAFIREKTGELQYSEREIAAPDGIAEIIGSLKPVRYVESMANGNYYKICLADGEKSYEVMFYINADGIDETAAVRKLDENGDSEWLWECKIPDSDMLNRIW